MSSAKFFAALVLVALTAAASTARAPALAGEKPRLVLKGPRLQMLEPGRAARGLGKRVDVRARLEGDFDDPETYYCLDEIWDWGDGTESVREPDCDPFEEGTELKTNFTDTHYFGTGRWIITLALMEDDDVVIEGHLEIRIF